MKQISKTPSRYSGDRKPVNLVMSSEVVNLAKDYFATTKHKTLSRFVESAIKAAIRKDAARVRSGGLKIPEGVFAK